MKISASTVLLLVLGLVIFAGCIQPPITNVEATQIYELKADASMKIVTVEVGTATDQAQDWVGDCSKKIAPMFDALIAQMNLAKTMGSANAQITTAQIDKIISVVNVLKDSMTCTFEKTGDKGTLTMAYTLTEQNVNDLKELSALSQQPTTRPTLEISRKGGNIVFSIPIQEQASTLSATGGETTKAIKVKVEGTLVSLSPSGYKEENGYYVFENVSALSGQAIVVEYTPSSGFSSLMIYGAIAAVGIIVIIAVAAIVRKPKK